MRLINNAGSDRVVDELQSCLAAGSRLDFASPGFSPFAAILEQHGITTVRSL